MALTANVATPAEATLGTTLTRINPGAGVRVVWLTSTGDVYLVYDDALDDGGAVPASARFRIPAGTAWPIEVTGKRILVAAVTGAPTASVLGSSG